MFTLSDLKAAHAKVRTGADFPKYVQQIKALGLLYYEFVVTDGSIRYFGEKGYQVKSEPMYDNLIINPNASAEALQHSIAIHQQGQTDFLTFCRQVADAGVDKWVIDTQQMVCFYRDVFGKLVVAEAIPDSGH